MWIHIRIIFWVVGPGSGFRKKRANLGFCKHLLGSSYVFHKPLKYLRIIKNFNEDIWLTKVFLYFLYILFSTDVDLDTKLDLRGSIDPDPDPYSNLDLLSVSCLILPPESRGGGAFFLGHALY